MNWTVFGYPAGGRLSVDDVGRQIALMVRGAASSATTKNSGVFVHKPISGNAVSVGRCDKTLVDSSLAALFKTDCPRSRLGGTARSKFRPDPGSSIFAPRFRGFPAQDPRARLCFADRHVRRRYRRSAG